MKHKRTPPTKQPAWIKCEACDDFYCTVHHMHVYDCDCPPIDEWDIDPYSGTLPGPKAA